MKPSPIELLFWLPLIAILVASGPAMFAVPTVVALAGVRGVICALLPARRRRPWATRSDVQSAALIALGLLLFVGVVIAMRS